MLTDELESENSEPPEAKVVASPFMPLALSIHLVIIDGKVAEEYPASEKESMNLQGVILPIVLNDLHFQPQV